jgi:hypothetical protein
VRVTTAGAGATGSRLARGALRPLLARLADWPPDLPRMRPPD